MLCLLNAVVIYLKHILFYTLLSFLYPCHRPAALNKSTKLKVKSLPKSNFAGKRCCQGFPLLRLVFFCSQQNWTEPSSNLCSISVWGKRGVYNVVGSWDYKTTSKLESSGKGFWKKVYSMLKGWWIQKSLNWKNQERLCAKKHKKKSLFNEEKL